MITDRDVARVQNMPFYSNGTIFTAQYSMSVSD